MKKQRVTFCALAMAVMMVASPVACVWAAEGMNEAESVWEAVPGQETVVETGNGRDIVSDRITTCSSQYTGYNIKSKSAKVRSGPGTNYSVIYTLKKGQHISVISISKGWAKFKYDERIVYINMSDIEKAL